MSLDTLRAGLAAAPERPRRAWRVMATATAVMVVVLAAAGWAHRTHPSAPVAARTPAHHYPPAAPNTSSTTAAPARVWPTTSTTPAAAAPPLVVEHGGSSYAVGAAGDRAVLGRFRCGEPLLAVLRGDGDAFLFTSWASNSADVVGAPIGHVDNASDVRAEDSDGNGCDELVVTRADGTSERLTP